MSRAPNSKNDIIWTDNANEVPPAEISNRTSSIHVWAGVCSKGKTELVFIEDSLTAKKYIEILESKLLPKMNELYKKKQWSFMQDNAPPHTANKTQIWLANNVPFFWDKYRLPAKSPDLNPIENLWSIVEEKIDHAKLNSKI